MQTIPLQAIPSQKVTAMLGGQKVDIALQQRTNGLYANIWLNGKMIMAGIICQNKNFIVNAPYKGLSGDLCFIDTQGKSDPDYSGLGSRFTLLWIEPG